MVMRHRKPVDPGKPHAFVRPGRSGLAQFASGSGGLDQGGAAAGLYETSLYLRESPICEVPGCGRTRDDDIHVVVRGR
jgi:hypothetical protein